MFMINAGICIEIIRKAVEGMIFYFTGTGNSKWIAGQIAEALEDQAVNLMTVDPKAYHFSEKDYLGIVFPVYAYAAPEPVTEFVQKLEPNGAFTFTVCNYSNVTGHAMQRLSEEGMHMNSGYGLLMPDNTTVIGSTYDTEETTLKKLSDAKERLDAIIQRIKAKEVGVFESIEGENPEENSEKMLTVFREKRSFTAPFHVTEDKCVSCGLCERICPAKAIELKDGRPVWVKEKCYVCAGCINRCPKEAIEYGGKSQGKYRYTFEKYNRKVRTALQK